MSVIHITGKYSFTRAQFIQFVLRLAVGILLMVKGFYFIKNMTSLQSMVLETNTIENAGLLATYIAWAHMLGGALIVLGLLTRFAVLLQIPIIIGAFWYNLGANTFGTGGELVLTIVVLILLLYFLIVGSGKISMDAYRKNHPL